MNVVRSNGWPVVEHCSVNVVHSNGWSIVEYWSVNVVHSTGLACCRALLCERGSF